MVPRRVALWRPRKRRGAHAQLRGEASVCHCSRRGRGRFSSAVCCDVALPSSLRVARRPGGGKRSVHCGAQPLAPRRPQRVDVGVGGEQLRRQPLGGGGAGGSARSHAAVLVQAGGDQLAAAGQSRRRQATQRGAAAARRLRRLGRHGHARAAVHGARRVRGCAVSDARRLAPKRLRTAA